MESSQAGYSRSVSLSSSQLHFGRFQDWFILSIYLKVDHLIIKKTIISLKFWTKTKKNLVWMLDNSVDKTSREDYFDTKTWFGRLNKENKYQSIFKTLQ